MKEKYNIHFIGIGGIGMSGIASILLNEGHNVSGSDLNESDITQSLISQGAKIYVGHSSKNISKNLDCVVRSSAIGFNNPEYQEAKEFKIPILQRAEMLAELTKLKTGIAIAGTHGKTTSSSIVARILFEAKLDPTFVIGGQVYGFEQNARQGSGDLFVFEADESDGSFLKFSPQYVILTNIDTDHMEFYKTEENLKNSFLQFINNIPFYGFSIINIDDEKLSSLTEKIDKKFITISLKNEAEYSAKITCHKTNKFEISHFGKLIGEFEFTLPGTHNIYNALGAFALSHKLGVSNNIIKKALSEFQGVKRRFDILEKSDTHTIVDDYAHHPTEISCVIKAAKNRYKDEKVYVLFEPHRYTRLKESWSEFISCFAGADEVVISNIYSAGENPIEGVSSVILANNIENVSKTSHLELKDGFRILSDEVRRNGGVLLCLGAGAISTKVREFLKDV